MDQAESLRNIVKKQSVRPVERTARVITVTSGKGGVGKTSMSVNLAINLSRMGKRVIMMDTDFGLANVEIMLGMRPRYTLADMMFRGKGILDIIADGPEDIGFISGGSGINEMANLTREQVFHLTQKLAEIDRLADVIIVDTGAGISDAVLEFVAASAEVLLVVTPEPTSITDAYALLKALNQCSSYRPDGTVVKMIANQVRGEYDAGEMFEKIGSVVTRFLNIKIQYLGAVPYDPGMSRAVIRQEPLCVAYPRSAAARSLRQIAEKLVTGKEVKERGSGIARLFTNMLRGKEGR